jgi:hypothetical protein
MRRFIILLHTSTYGSPAYMSINNTVPYRFNKEKHSPKHLVDNNPFVPIRHNLNDLNYSPSQFLSPTPTPYTLVDFMGTLFHLETLDTQQIIKADSKPGVFVSVVPANNHPVMASTIRTLIAYLLPHNNHIFTPMIIQIFLDRLMNCHQQLTPQQLLAGQQSGQNFAPHGHQLKMKPSSTSVQPDEEDGSIGIVVSHDAGNTLNQPQQQTFPPFPRHFWYGLSLIIASNPEIASKIYTMTSRFFISRYWNDPLYKIDFYDIANKFKGSMPNILFDFINAKQVAQQAQFNSQVGNLDQQRYQQYQMKNTIALQGSSYRLLVRLPYQVLQHSLTMTFSQLHEKHTGVSYNHYALSTYREFMTKDSYDYKPALLHSIETNTMISLFPSYSPHNNNNNNNNHTILPPPPPPSSSTLSVFVPPPPPPPSLTSPHDDNQTVQNNQTASQSQLLSYLQNAINPNDLQSLSTDPVQHLQPIQLDDAQAKASLFPDEEIQLYVALQWLYDQRSHNVLHRHLPFLKLNFLQSRDSQSQLPQWLTMVYDTIVSRNQMVFYQQQMQQQQQPQQQQQQQNMNDNEGDYNITDEANQNMDDYEE